MGETSRVVIDVEALENSMKQSILSFGIEPRKREPCTIYRVFHSVRRDDEHAYDPKIIAIGPFHRDKDSLKPMESIKWRYIRHLIERSPNKNSLQNYIKTVNDFKEEARSYYLEPVEPNDNVFVEMMVLDGCFLIEFLVKSYLGVNSRLNEVNWNLPLLRSDLLLLENQFPFPILKSLYDMSDIPQLIGLKDDETDVTLMDLAANFVTKNNCESLEAWKFKTVHHLLHVYHTSIVTITDSNQEQSTCCCCCGHKAIKTLTQIKTLASVPVLWLLSSFLYCKIPLNCLGSCKSHVKEEKPKAPRRILTATQLRNSGVKFEKGAASSFVFAKFCKETGVMKIAKLAIQEATISQFRNLIAFEQCNLDSDTHFTSHAVLMDNLIDTPEDVAILKSSHIIESKLGHDEEVAQFFNNLCKGAYLDYEKHHHHQLFRDVTEYCNVTRHKWRAELIHDYFGNPWSTVSVIAAVVLLILTFLSTFYAMYAYHHPPSPPS